VHDAARTEALAKLGEVFGRRVVSRLRIFLRVEVVEVAEELVEAVEKGRVGGGADRMTLGPPTAGGRQARPAPPSATRGICEELRGVGSGSGLRPAAGRTQSLLAAANGGVYPRFRLRQRITRALSDRPDLLGGPVSHGRKLPLDVAADLVVPHVSGGTADERANDESDHGSPPRTG
jgi:hypothetical protein